MGLKKHIHSLEIYTVSFVALLNSVILMGLFAKKGAGGRFSSAKCKSVGLSGSG